MHFFCEFLMNFFSGFRAKFQKIVTCVAFSINLRKQIRNLPKILNFVKIIHYHSNYSFRSLVSFHVPTNHCSRSTLRVSGPARRLLSTDLNAWICLLPHVVLVGLNFEGSLRYFPARASCQDLAVGRGWCSLRHVAQNEASRRL